MHRVALTLLLAITQPPTAKADVPQTVESATAYLQGKLDSSQAKLAKLLAQLAKLDSRIVALESALVDASVANGPEIAVLLEKLEIKRGKLTAKVATTNGTIANLEQALVTLEEPFDYCAEVSAPFAITVVDAAGQPLRGARVTVESGDLECASGTTDQQGMNGGVVTIPKNIEFVDVVVQLPGHSGPWSDEAARKAAGPFAPSARVRVARAQLGNVAIELHADAAEGGAP